VLSLVAAFGFHVVVQYLEIYCLSLNALFRITGDTSYFLNFPASRGVLRTVFCPRIIIYVLYRNMKDHLLSLQSLEKCLDGVVRLLKFV